MNSGPFSPSKGGRSDFGGPQPLISRAIGILPHSVSRRLYRLLGARAQGYSNLRFQTNWQGVRHERSWKDLWNLPNGIIVIWILLLWWGERVSFKSSVGACHWDSWEQWPANARPHHLTLIADPQLVDPHTYPGRPWPLSTLTVKHTDLYLYRSYSSIQRILKPESIVFLGDLFDGGREWSTAKSQSPEQRYRGYRELFWLKEFDRFGRIFFKNWRKDKASAGSSRSAQRIIAGLPGNHDLGIGVGIQRPVRDRFNAYFGETNRVDVIGNHTFVSVDTVSLSAFGQADPNTASQGSGLGDGPQQEIEKIWKPVMNFLDTAKVLKYKAVLKELKLLNGQEIEGSKFSQEVIDLPGPPMISKRGLGDGTDKRVRVEQEEAELDEEFPAVVLSHVPLYRAEGTPCGPLREHWPSKPPRKGQAFPENDLRNAIAIRGGYQYQNVLTPGLSKDLVEKIGNVHYVFSGDDHDYCDVLHKEYTSSGGSSGLSGVREITVKSISWAMGVRKPGFLLVSLWNPVDSQGRSIKDSKNDAPTLQTHLCLLPDQLGIFIRYGILVALTGLSLLARALLVEFKGYKPFAEPVLRRLDAILPVSRPSSTSPSSAENEKGESRHNGYKSHLHSASDSSQGSQSATTSNSGGRLSVRSSAARTRSLSPCGGYGIPASQTSNGVPPNGPTGLGIHFGGYNEANKSSFDRRKGLDAISQKLALARQGQSLRVAERVFCELWWSLWRVIWVSTSWYLWLIWH